MSIRIYPIAVVVALSGCLSCQVSTNVPDSIQIVGRVVRHNGESIPGAAVGLMPIGTSETTAIRRSLTDRNGMFMFVSQPLQKYELYVADRGVKSVTTTIEAGTRKDIDIGKIVLESCPPLPPSPPPGTVVHYPTPDLPMPEPVGDLKLEQIIVEPRQPSTNDWQSLKPMEVGMSAPEKSKRLRLQQVLGGVMGFGVGDPLQCCCAQAVANASIEHRAAWEVASDVAFAHDITVESFVGGKVKAIRVVRFRFSGKAISTPDGIRDEVRKVWLGRFWHASSHLGWAEGAPWNVEAMVEYEDGKRSSILMDNWMHVQVQDRNGRFWFIRLRPAVD